MREGNGCGQEHGLQYGIPFVRGVDYEDDGDKFPTAKWQSDTFRKEAGKYFDLPHLIAYYLYVQFNLGVDQLAKTCLSAHGTV